MEREFLNRFYSTRRSVSMLELTSTKQRKDEPVVDYINRWRSLSLDCKDRVSELSAVEMCIQAKRKGNCSRISNATSDSIKKSWLLVLYSNCEEKFHPMEGREILSDQGLGQVKKKSEKRKNGAYKAQKC
ncbi:hypothetical protein L3X38_041567 [Prunus dulcis]|uniref:Retrotransposon gag domain-containing protein n=1 Tax=Prunus dulcis TaxID=3755 RepID=A0AAD4UUM0_PRUDU|nr:hypothetical protein L3X38_041567 [Prunus dulcis]